MVDLNEITKHTALQFIQDRLNRQYGDDWKLRDADVWRALLFAFGHQAVDVVRQASNAQRVTAWAFDGQTHIRLGLNLTRTMPRYLSHSTTRDSNLLNIVGGFLKYGDEQQQKQARNIHAKLIKNEEGAWAKKTSTQQQSFFEHHGTWWNPVDPQKYDLPPLTWDHEKDPFCHHISTLGWIDKDQAFRLLRRASEGWFDGLPMAALMCRYLGKHEDAVVRAAENMVRNYKKPQPDYNRVARWLKLVRPDFFNRWCQTLTGVKQAFAVVRADANDTAFYRGIRQLTSDKPRIELGGWVAKPLKFKMVSRMSLENFVILLHELPWRVVQPMVTEEKDKVTNKLIDVLDRPDLLEKSRMLFHDHKGRLEAKDWTLDNHQGEVPDEAFLWDSQMHKSTKLHRAARDYRKKVLALPDMDPYRLFLIAHHMMKEPDEKRLHAYVSLLQEVDTKDSIEKAMRGFPEHLLPGYEF